MEGLWGASAVGVIGGNPKSGKTWLGLDMAVSVSSGTEALGRFRVLEPGTALVYLAEDSLQSVRERVSAIARHRRLGILELELFVITAESLRLDLEAQRLRLFETVEQVKPRLLLLDPLVRLHRLDENSASEISALLASLRELQRRFDTAVVLVHHVRKGATSQAGQALRGSGDLWAFGDSNLYLRRLEGNLLLSVEHRSARAPEPLLLRLVDEDEARIHLEVIGTPRTKTHGLERALDEVVLDVLKNEGALSREQLRERLRVKNERLGWV
ncbi:MAG: AAA family ATPase, partial [Thermoanaerobaculia bacterium]